MKINVGLIGENGKMGRKILSLIPTYPKLFYSGGIKGKKSFSPSTLEALMEKSNLLIDFSSPDTLDITVEKAVSHGLSLVIGTTGLLEKHFTLLKKGSEKIPIFYAPNFSLGIALFKKIASFLSQNLPEQTSIILTDYHHREKKDAPSGTALSLIKAIEQDRGQKVSTHSIRAGNIIGEHTLEFITDEERITISHQALDRDLFAKGALQAALFLHDKPPSLYSMEDLCAVSKNLQMSTSL